MSRVLREIALPVLLAAGALALSFFMVGNDYEAFGGWLAVMVALLGAAVAHGLTQRRRIPAPPDDGAQKAAHDREASNAAQALGVERVTHPSPASAGADGG